MASIESIEEGIEEKVIRWTETGNVSEEELSELFSNDEVEEYSRKVQNPKMYINVLKSLSDILEQYIGEPIFCIEAISTLSYTPVKTMAEKFKGDKPTQEAINSLVKYSLGHIFHETQDIGLDELCKYLPIIKPWVKYLSDSQVYDTVSIGIESSLETLRMYVEDGDKEEINKKSKSIKLKLDFVNKTRKDIYDKIISELSTDFSDELQLVK